MPTFAKQESSRGEGRRVASDVTQLTASDDPVERKIEQDHKRFKAHLAKLFEDLPTKVTKN